MKKLAFRVLLSMLTLLPAGSTFAQWSVKGTSSDKNVSWNLLQTFTPEAWNASNFASEKDLQWFNEARYGMFIHFGLSTFKNAELSWGICKTRKAPDMGSGPFEESVWTQWPKEFKFEKYNAEEWVRIAKNAGCKYIVVIAKHHDGFHLWDTKYSDFKVTNTPYGKDFLKEIADACHRAGMKFGVYYSQRDWYHPDYAPVDPELIDGMPEPPYYKPKPGVAKVVPGKSHAKYIEYQYNVVRELCTNYGKLDVFWFDASWWGGMFTADMWDAENLTRMIRKLQPGILINNRASVPGDFDTPEQKIGMYQERAWESCMTLCRSWSYSQTPVKSLKTLVEMMSSSAYGNGNMLLSWGPKWDGAFDAYQVEALYGLGNWLKTNGHTIYNTKGGPWYPGEWGGSTYRNKQAWLHVKKNIDHLELKVSNNNVVSVKTLSGLRIPFVRNNNSITLDFSKVKFDTLSNIFELKFSKPIAGLMDSKKKISKFDDPVYGQIISENASLNFSSVTVKDLIPVQNQLLHQGKLRSAVAFETKPELQPSVTLDLNKVVEVTGIAVYNQENGPMDGRLAVSISNDGVQWKSIASTNAAVTQWELPVTQYTAGIELPGVKTRYIKIQQTTKKPTSLSLKKVFVYGK